MKNLKRQFTLIGTLLALVFFALPALARASTPPVLIDVVEIVDPAPFIIHTNILPGDTFLHPMTVKNLTGSSQDIVMNLDIILSEGIVPVIPFELEERIFVKIKRLSTASFLILPGPGTDTEATLQELDDTFINLGTIGALATENYEITFVFDPNAGNEYQNTKVYFNVVIGLEVPNVRASLQVFKWNGSVAPEAPGNEVAYTLRVTARDGDVNAVTLTDLPPAGFKYKDGTWTAHSSFETDINPLTNHIGVLELFHPYASPGIWHLGTIQQDEVVTLTYSTTISTSQDDGLYKDLAFAKGTNGNGDAVLAVDPNDSDNFVGTDVAVVTPTSEAVQLKEKDKTDTTTKRIIKRVLGASILPATGAQISWVILALVLFVSGLGMMMYAKKKKAMALKNSNEVITKILLLFVLGASVLALPSMASAANISVRIETPKALVNSPDFKIGFVVLDISNGTPDVVCEVNNGGGFTSFPAAHIEYVAQPGGNSGNCVVDATVMPADGDYTFRVTANDSVLSGEVPVELISATPGTPLNYNREKNSCGVSFTTANDGLTTGVELYRSTESSFVADASTLATTLAIGPNMNGAMIDPGADCRDYFYAIRAVSSTGAGSGFVGDENVNVKHKTNTKTVTQIVPGPATGGAIPITGGGAAVGGGVSTGAEAVQGAETENTQGQAGAVLGEETTTNGGADQGAFGWVKNHPWWSSLLFFGFLALLIYSYRVYQRNKYDEYNQPK